MRTVITTLLSTILFISCSENIETTEKSHEVIISIREKQFDYSEITFVMNGEYKKPVIAHSYTYSGIILTKNECIIFSDDETTEFEYDVYVRSKGGVYKFEGIDYYLLNEKEGYTSPIVKQGEVFYIEIK